MPPLDGKFTMCDRHHSGCCAARVSIRQRTLDTSRHLEGNMVIRRLAAASAEVLVLFIGVVIATPYFLILASPFIGR
jgi:hypothetical protein